MFVFGNVVVAAIFDFMTMELIGESRNSNPYGRCEGERRKGERGRGEKKYFCPISLFFWETPYASKWSSSLVRYKEVD